LNRVAQQGHPIQFQLQQEMRAAWQGPMKEDANSMRRTVYQFSPLKLQSLTFPICHDDHRVFTRDAPYADATLIARDSEIPRRIN
jgi:hypothetical protein